MVTKYFSILASLLISLLGISVLVPVLMGSGSFSLNILIGLISVAFAVILVSTVSVALGARIKFARGAVAASCVFIPAAWLFQSIHWGILRGSELLSMLLFFLGVIFQWYVFEAFRLRSEA